MDSRDIRLLPKANLHLHLTGSMRAATLAELAERDGIAVPEPMAPGIAHPWSAFQSRYDTARSTLRTAEDLARVVTEAIADDAADGCGWLELQVDPTTYAVHLGSPEAVVEAILNAMPRDRAGLIVAAGWGLPPEAATALASLAVRYAGSGVTGFGLSNDERLGTVADFAPATRVASDAGLLITPHAGFYEPSWHVRDAVTVLGAHRIGHGLTAATDPSTLDLLATRRVTIECCPTSYPPLGVVADLAATPLRTFLDAGVPVALGTDDPLLFGAGLADQYAIARHQIGLTDTELAVLARHSIRGSAAPSAVQARLLSEVDDWLTTGSR